MKTLLWTDEAATQAFAEALARKPAVRNAFIELEGELGAGKTTLVRHLLRTLGVQGRIKSPTYAVVEPYTVSARTGDAVPSQGDTLVWHFDFYRFTDAREWEDAGFRDIFASPGLKLAEWAAHARAALPLADLVIRIAPQADETREVCLQANTPVGKALLA
jgi:tRNA threonylcarbamoyladenosine biosynthesis protein TsaE